MRYAYGLSTALLLGGATISLVTGQPAGAQVAQNDDRTMASFAPRAGAPASFAELTAQLQPAVVNISTRQRVEIETRNPFAGTPFADLFSQRGGPNQPQTREAQSLGSGFFISADGYVVTNNHVISPEGRGTVEEITVTLPDGTEYAAELVGADAQSDLAVLKVNRAEPFPFVQFGDSSNARVGDWVIAIGNPFGLGGTVTSGIVSAQLRTAGGGAYDRFIQTDAAINQGNSGGPLFDMQGKVIGINNRILSPSAGSIGLGFAIPAEIAQPIVEQLRKGQTIERGYLGVQIGPVTDDVSGALGLPRNQGEIVQTVVEGEAADRSGIRAGDIIISINGKEVTPEQTLSYLIANIAPGTKIPVELIREGKRQRLDVTVGKRPSQQELAQAQIFSDDESDGENAPASSEESEEIAGRLGLQVVPVTPEIARQLGVGADMSGLAIAAVDPNSDAARKGLRRRDVILSANYQDVATIADLEAIIEEADSEGRDAILLRFQRGSQTAFQAVRLR